MGTLRESFRRMEALITACSLRASLFERAGAQMDASLLATHFFISVSFFAHDLCTDTFRIRVLEKTLEHEETEECLDRVQAHGDQRADSVLFC